MRAAQLNDHRFGLRDSRSIRLLLAPNMFLKVVIEDENDER